MQKLQNRSQGFTIIEVLIVLVIAAVIMLIVFLAVPALQRNSRNNSYRNEAGQILSAASEFMSNNNGTPPGTGDASTVMGLTRNQSITSLQVTAGAGASTPTFSQAILRTGSRCGTISGGSSHTTVSGSSRSLALVYAVENSSGSVVAQCQES